MRGRGDNISGNDGDSIYGSIGPRWIYSKLTMKYEKQYENLHTVETQLAIRADNRQKAGIYMIENKVTGEKYVGSAITNRINVKFRNHMIHGTGAKNTAKAVKMYGIENFKFYILEYYGGLIQKENLSAGHLELLQLETKYISVIKPAYNINEVVESEEHTKGAIQRDQNSQFNSERKVLLSKIATLRKQNEELRAKLEELSSRPVTLYNMDGSVHSEYPGVCKLAKTFGCSTKTVNNAIAKGKVFRGIGYLKLE